MQKNEILEFLGKIDAHLAANYAPLPGGAKFPLKIIGKCSLLIAGMTDAIGTVDLDSLGITGSTDTETNQTIASALIKEFGRNRQTIHGYYLEFVAPALVFLPNRPTWVPLQGPWKGLSVTHLEPHQTIASKCFSAFSTSPRKKDSRDVIAALDQKIVDLKEVLHYADDIFDIYTMDARSERFPSVYKFINEELIPNYGGGRLKYKPEDE